MTADFKEAAPPAGGVPRREPEDGRGPWELYTPPEKSAAAEPERGPWEEYAKPSPLQARPGRKGLTEAFVSDDPLSFIPDPEIREGMRLRTSQSGNPDEERRRWALAAYFAQATDSDIRFTHGNLDSLLEKYSGGRRSVSDAWNAVRESMLAGRSPETLEAYRRAMNEYGGRARSTSFWRTMSGAAAGMGANAIWGALAFAAEEATALHWTATGAGRKYAADDARKQERGIGLLNERTARDRENAFRRAYGIEKKPDVVTDGLLRPPPRPNALGVYELPPRPYAPDFDDEHARRSADEAYMRELRANPDKYGYVPADARTVSDAEAAFRAEVVRRYREEHGDEAAGKAAAAAEKAARNAARKADLERRKIAVRNDTEGEYIARIQALKDAFREKLEANKALYHPGDYDSETLTDFAKRGDAARTFGKFLALCYDQTVESILPMTLNHMMFGGTGTAARITGMKTLGAAAAETARQAANAGAFYAAMKGEGVTDYIDNRSAAGERISAEEADAYARRHAVYETVPEYLFGWGPILNRISRGPLRRTRDGFLREAAAYGAEFVKSGASDTFGEFVTFTAEKIDDAAQGFGTPQGKKLPEMNAKEFADYFNRGLPEMLLTSFFTAGAGGMIGAVPQRRTVHEFQRDAERMYGAVESRLAELREKGELTGPEAAEYDGLTAAVESGSPAQLLAAVQRLAADEMAHTARVLSENAPAENAPAENAADAAPAAPGETERTAEENAVPPDGTDGERRTSAGSPETETGTEIAPAAEEDAAPDVEIAAAAAARAEQLRSKLPHSPADTEAEVLRQREGLNVDVGTTETWTREEIAAITARIMRQYHMSEEDAYIYAAATVRALWHDGRIIVNTRNTRPGDVRFLLAHEAALHEGIRVAFGEKAANQLFDAVWQAQQNSELMAQILDKYRLRREMRDEQGEALLDEDGNVRYEELTEQEKREAAEEFLARLQETGGVTTEEIYADNRAEIDAWGRAHGFDTHDLSVKRDMVRQWMSDTGFRPARPGWLKDLLTRIRIWLMRHGYMVHRLSDDDILSILSRSARAVRRRGAERPERSSAPADGESRFTVGDKFSVIRDALPSEKGETPLLKMRFFSSIDEAVTALTPVFEALPDSVTAADGKTVLIKNPEKGSLENRLRHLIAGKDRKTGQRTLLDSKNKIAWLPRIAETLTKAQAKIQDPVSKNHVYVRTYEEGAIHVVVVSQNGAVDGTELFDYGMISQFADYYASRRWGFTVIWERSREDNTHPPAKQNSESTGEVPSSPAYASADTSSSSTASREESNGDAPYSSADISNVTPESKTVKPSLKDFSRNFSESPSDGKSNDGNAGSFRYAFDEDAESAVGENVRFSVVTDEAEIARLESEDYIVAYRAAQIGPDGKLYPPMSGRVDGEWRTPIELGKWERAEERPDLIKMRNGRPVFVLDKGNGSSVTAAYNPYIHSSLSPLNDQFSSAYRRPGLVTLEVHIPKSELTSGYRAEHAKNAVGVTDWHAGAVSGKLSKGKKRQVILSRWAKPVRIVPDGEVARKIKELLQGENVTIPANVVTPSLRRELEKLGVPVTDVGRSDKSDAAANHVRQLETLEHSRYQENAMLAADAPIPIVTAVGKAIAVSRAEAEIERKIRENNGRLIVHNPDQNMPIQVLLHSSLDEAASEKAISETVSDGTSPEVHAAALHNLEELLKHARLGLSHRDWHVYAKNQTLGTKRETALQIHRFYVGMKYNNALYGVELTVREKRSGATVFYTLEAHDLNIKEVLPNTEASGSGVAKPALPAESPVIQFSAFFEKFKPINDLLGLKYKEIYPDVRFALDEEAEATVVDVPPLGIDVKDTAAVKQYLYEHFKGREVTIRSDGRLSFFSGHGLKATLKRRNTHRKSFAALDRVIENSYPVGYETVDQAHAAKRPDLLGQFVYASLLNIGGESYVATVKLDDTSMDHRALFKDISIKRAGDYLYAGHPAGAELRTLPGKVPASPSTIHDVIEFVKKDFAEIPGFSDSMPERGSAERNDGGVRAALDDETESSRFRNLVAMLRPIVGRSLKQDAAWYAAACRNRYGVSVTDQEAWVAAAEAAAANREAERRMRLRRREEWLEENYPLYQACVEFAGENFRLKPSARFLGESFTGSWISPEYVKYSGKRRQGRNESDGSYRRYLARREEALAKASGAATDEIAAAVARRTGGDAQEIEQELVDFFRDLKKRDFYREYSRFQEETLAADREEARRAKEEFMHGGRSRIEDAAVEVLERGEPVTREWAEADIEVYEELVRMLLPDRRGTAVRRVTDEDLETINAAITQRAGDASTYAQGYRKAREEAYRRYLEELRGLKEEAMRDRADAAALQREALSFAEKHLPKENRAEFVRRIVGLAGYTTTPTEKYPDGRRKHEFDRIVASVTDRMANLRRERALADIREMLAAVRIRRNYKGIPVSVLPSEQNRVERIRRIVDLDYAALAAAVAYNNGRLAEIEQLAAEEDSAPEGDGDGRAAELLREREALTEDNRLLELFGDLGHRDASAADEAARTLKEIIAGGKLDLRGRLSARLEDVGAMRERAVKDALFGGFEFRTGGDAGRVREYMLRNMSLGTLLRLVSGMSIQNFDESIAGEFYRRTEDASWNEATAIRRMQDEFDKALRTLAGADSLRKRGRFLRAVSEVTEHTGVYRTEFSRPIRFRNRGETVLERGRRKAVPLAVPVEDYTTPDGVRHDGARSLLRRIDNGETVTEYEGTPLTDVGIAFLRRQLADHDAGVKAVYEIFADRNDDAAINRIREESGRATVSLIKPDPAEIAQRTEVPLSQGQALQLLLTWEQEDFRPGMIWNGWTQESIDQIRRFLRPEVLKLGRWMRDSVASRRAELDAATYERYGAHLPPNPNYFPGVFQRGGSGTAQAESPLGRGAGTMSVNPGFLVARRFHLYPPDVTADAFQVYLGNRIGEAHFLAWSGVMRDLQSVYGSRAVQNAISDKFGRDVARNLTDRIATMARGGGAFTDDYASRLMVRLYKYWMPARIAINPNSYIKQMLGAAAYMNQMPVADFVKYFVKANFTNPEYRAFVAMAKESDYFRNRLSGSLDKDLQYLLNYTRDTNLRSPFTEALMQAGTLGTRLTDAWSALHGGFAIYQYTLDQARKSGKNDGEAHELARRAWMRATDETQQSGYLKDQNFFQSNQGTVRWLTMFMSNPIQTMNLQLQTMHELVYGRDRKTAAKKLVRQIFINHLVVPTLMQFTTDMMRNGFDLGDWWDEEDFADYLIGWALGSFSSIFLFGKLAENVGGHVLDRVAGGKRRRFSDVITAIPLAEDLKRDWDSVGKLFDGDPIRAHEIFDAIRALGDAGMAAGTADGRFGTAGAMLSALGSQGRRISKWFEKEPRRGRASRH